MKYLSTSGFASTNRRDFGDCYLKMFITFYFNECLRPIDFLCIQTNRQPYCPREMIQRNEDEGA